MFTDVEGSTRRWEADADDMRADLLLRMLILDHLPDQAGDIVHHRVTVADEEDANIR